MPVVLAAVLWTGVWPLALLGALCVAWGSFELGGLAGARFPPVLGMALYLDAAMIVGLSLIDLQLAAVVLLGLTVLGVLAAQRLLIGRRDRVTLEMASLWIGAPAAAVPLLHLATFQDTSAPWSYRSLALLVLLPLWAGDIAAILAGRAWGRRLLLPLVSPKKTVEGAVANLVAATAVAGALSVPLQVPPMTALACGAAVGVLGQIGDLFESALKRSVGVKDSGALFPGHGGMLDRVDSLLFAAPAVAAILVVGR